MDNYLEHYIKQQMIGLMVYSVVYLENHVKIIKNNNRKHSTLSHLMDQLMQFILKT